MRGNRRTKNTFVAVESRSLTESDGWRVRAANPRFLPTTRDRPELAATSTSPEDEGEAIPPPLTHPLSLPPHPSPYSSASSVSLSFLHLILLHSLASLSSFPSFSPSFFFYLSPARLFLPSRSKKTQMEHAAAAAANDNHATAALCERPLTCRSHPSVRERRRIARNKAPRFVADAVANGCAVTGPHSTEPRMRDATHSIVFYILPGRFSPRLPWSSSLIKPPEINSLMEAELFHLKLVAGAKPFPLSSTPSVSKANIEDGLLIVY
ncbi:hypothetical protein ALC56_11992 [Trachymyrmex septentrionalis]|uniref:Uncharacterized protein n=1 Tax=Trachymyrmex septentrionalis TaxID=34720 RepID=A0A195F0U7_9HYME|nr:hypothetical protein ALC56_11992 [Trachymyrmex septentrionalis]